jgi:hypothetical protein
MEMGMLWHGWDFVKDTTEQVARIGVLSYMTDKGTADKNELQGNKSNADEFREYARRKAPLCVKGLVLYLSARGRPNVIEGVDYHSIAEAVKKFSESDGLKMSEEELKAAIEDAKYEGLLKEEGGLLHP